MIPTFQEAVYAVYGTWRLFLLDPGGLGYLDDSIEGFWKSFFAAVIIAPGYVILVVLHLLGTRLGAGLFEVFTIEVLAYAISWLAFPLAAYHVCIGIDKQPRYVGYIVAYNWASVVQMVVFLPVTLIDVAGILPHAVMTLATLMVWGIILGYKWFITRTCLAVPGLGAAGFVVLDLVLGFVVAEASDRAIL